MNQPQDLAAIAERIEKLERDNAWLKRIAATVVLVATALLLMGQSKPGTPWYKQTLRAGTIQANKIELVTTQGQRRALLSISPSSRSEFVMFGEDGQAEIDIAGGLLEVGGLKTDETGQVQMASIGSGQPWVRLSGAGLIVERDKSVAMFDSLTSNEIRLVEQHADNLAAGVDYLMHQEQLRLLQPSADDLKQKLDDLTKAACPVLKAVARAQRDEDVRRKVDAVCGLQ